MRKFYLLTLLAFLPLLANADAVEIDGIYYNLDAENHTAEVTTNPNEYSGDVVIPAAVMSQAANYSVTSIGDLAFRDCFSLTSITIPKNVTSIDYNAFLGCSALTSIQVESDNSVYDSRDNCNAIIETSTNTLIRGCKNTIIPTSVTTIGVEAFNCASGLLSLTIPSSVTSIGHNAFEACRDLVHVYCNAENVPTTDADAFENVDIGRYVTLHVPAGSVEAYQAAAPWNGFNKVVALSTNIPDVEILGIYYNLNEETLTAEVTKNPNGPYSGDLIVGGGIWYDSRLYSVTSIGKDAFALNGGITSVKILEGVTTIGEGAFGYCPYLTSVTFPSSLTSIGEAAFFDCERLASVMIPASVNSISDNSFRWCKSLASIQVEDGNTKYDSRNNCNAIIETRNNTLISGCKNTMIPNSVTSVGAFAFEGISGLTSLTIPNSVTSIGAWSFSYTGLTSLDIPASVTTIDNDAFTNCSSLASIQVDEGNTVFDSRDNSNAIIETATNTLIRASNTTVIPSTVTTIGYRAFGGSGITSVTIPSSITSIEYMAFTDCKDLESISVESGNTKYDSRNNCNAVIETETNTLIAGCKNTIIPNTVTSIGQYAFGGLGLTSITIPSSVTSIDHGAFVGNIELTDVYCYAEYVPNTENDAFWNNIINQVTLHVPAGSVDAYKAATPWSGFKEVKAIEPPKTINVETAGTLSTLISDAEKYTIEELTITGELNGTDFRLIREMAGNDYLGQPTNGMLKKLDISGANIVEGGEKYLDTDRVTSSTGTFTQMGGDFFHFGTQNNVLGNSLFAGCGKLEEIVLPNSITSIGEYVFWYCLNLKALEIPENVSSIGSDFVYGPNQLGKLTVAEGNQTYSSPANSNALMQGSKLVFGISSTQIPAGTTVIGSNAFEDCNSLGDVTLPEGVTTIEVGAFAWSGLTSINMPSTLTTIGNDAFAGCNGLTSFTLPKSVVTYGDGLGALKDCHNLTSIQVEDGNPNYDSRNDCNAIIETATNTLVSGCQTTVIPNTVTILGHQAFRGASLSDFVIPDWIIRIGERAFNSSSITSVKIPASVKSIGGNAFSWCNNLTNVTIDIKVPLAIDENTFSNRANIDLIVPVGSVGLYKAANYWKDFKSIKDTEGNTEPAATPISLTLNVETAGTLPTLISETDKYLTTELTLTGNLNGTDFRLIREMAGNDYQGQPTNGVLKKLDISGANIVEGGEKYLDTDNVYNSTGGYAHWGGEFFHFNTQDNVVGNAMFAGCEKLEEINLPENIISIGDLALWDCKNLKSLFIPKNVSTIGRSFIDGSNNITSISVAEENISFSSPANSNVIMQGTKLILGCCNSIIPTTTTIIGSDAFARCYPLGDVTLPEGVTTIEVGAFAWSGLTSINMPSTLTTIDNDAFAGCNGLTSFTLPKSVVSYGDGPDGGLGALKDCQNLTSIKVEDGNPKYDSRNDCNAIIETATNTLVSGCQATVIPNTVTILGHQAFRGASLSDFVIPDWIIRIGERAFNSSSITSVKIPASVKSIGGNAFSWCNNLTNVTIDIKVPLAIDENTFSNRANIDLIVPVGSVGLYKAANYWKDFKSIKDTDGNTEPAASPISLTLNVETAGTLPTLISETDKYLTTELTLTGNLNGTDFRLIREMAGSDYQGHPTNGKLQKLDLSGANIVAGGENYFDSNGLYNENGDVQLTFGSHSVTTKDNVIGECLFAGCSQLVEIKIPTNTIEVGEFAFLNTNISSFDIVGSVEKIALSFFWRSKVSTLSIPQNVTTLTASDCFMGNQSTLTSISVDENNSKYDSRNNCNAIIEKESNTLILGCKNSTVPDGVTSIGKCAFYGCNGLTSITLPTSVTSLQEYAFFDTRLTSISLPSSLKRIEYDAFAYTEISSITIPASVEYIGQSIMRACSNLTQITVDAGNTKYDSRDNCNAIIETSTNTLIQGCNTSTIPASVIATGSQAFKECHNLESITIPSGVTSIEGYAFADCDNMESIIIPSSVTSIGSYAFWLCRSLADVYCYAETVPTISSDAFDNSNIANATLHVPVGSIDAYKAADYWKDFGSIRSIVTSLFDGTNLWTSYVAQEDYDIPAGLEAYVISSLTETSAVASQIDYIPQGVPILLKRNDATTNSFDFTIGTGTAPTTNLLKVYDTDKTVSNREGYILYKDEFVLVDEGTLPAGRVFLPLNGGNAANTRGIVIEGEGTTGIQNLVSDSEVSHGVWYDLQGRKIDGKPIKKGVYILNGRKVVVK